MIRKTGLALAIAAAPLIAQADIDQATLYPSHASLVWEEVAQVASGSGVLEIEGLPVKMDDRSLQVELQGAGEVSVKHIQVEQVELQGYAAKARQGLQDEVERVESQLNAYRDRINSWEQQARVLSQASLNSRPESASVLSEMAQTVREGTHAASMEIRSIQAEMASSVSERDRLQRKLQAMDSQVKASKKVSIHYQGAEPGELTARVSFQTPDAGWRSEYDARLSTDVEGQPGGKVTLEHRAVIRQGTGMDWEDVEVRLATVDNRRGTEMRELSSWTVRARREANRKDLMSAGMASELADHLTQDARARVEKSSSYAHQYRLPERVDIPAESVGQRYLVSAHAIPVSVATWVAPVQNSTAYVHATGEFESDAPIPAGPVHLYRDGQSIGQNTLPALADGEAISMGFGVDDQVRSRVVNEIEAAGEEGMFSKSNVQRRQNRLEVTSHHTGAIQVRIFDRLPVSVQDALKVTELDMSEPVTRNVNDLKGVLAWDRVVQPGATVEIQSGFEVQAPDNMTLPRLQR